MPLETQNTEHTHTHTHTHTHKRKSETLFLLSLFIYNNVDCKVKSGFSLAHRTPPNTNSQSFQLGFVESLYFCCNLRLFALLSRKCYSVTCHVINPYLVPRMIVLLSISKFLDEGNLKKPADPRKCEEPDKQASAYSVNQWPSIKFSRNLTKDHKM